MQALGRTLAVDLGSRRTGLAVCDALGIAIRPLAAILTADAGERLEAVLAASKEEDVVRLLIGLPLNMDGSEGPAAAEARTFAAHCEARVEGLQILLWDERLTTVEASELLTSAGVRKDRQRERIDSTAAAVLLRTWIETRRRESSSFAIEDSIESCTPMAEAGEQSDDGAPSDTAEASFFGKRRRALRPRQSKRFSEGSDG